MIGVISAVVAVSAIWISGTFQSVPYAKAALGAGMFVSGIAAGLQVATNVIDKSEQG